MTMKKPIEVKEVEEIKRIQSRRSLSQGSKSLSRRRRRRNQGKSEEGRREGGIRGAVVFCL